MSATFFENMSVNYKDVRIDAASSEIDVPSFLEATENLIKLFGKSGRTGRGKGLGGGSILNIKFQSSAPILTHPRCVLGTDLINATAFGVVKSDMQGNVNVSDQGGACCHKKFAGIMG